MTHRVAPRIIGASAWVLLLAFSFADAVTANAFMRSLGSSYELNPLVVSLWESSGFSGLLLLKIATAGLLGLALVLIASRFSLSALVGLSIITFWAILSNLLVSASPAMWEAALFGAIPALAVGLLSGVLFYTVVYPRYAERRRIPRP